MEILTKYTLSKFNTCIENPQSSQTNKRASRIFFLPLLITDGITHKKQKLPLLMLTKLTFGAEHE